MPIEFLISALVTLLVVVDPLGLVPAFLAVTEERSDAVRRQVALRACLIASAILIGAALIGDWLLRQLGITLSAFRIAGGLLLFAVAFEMVLGLRVGHDAKDAEQAVEEHSQDIAQDIAAFPLAIPLMAGPGAITATILLAGQAAYRPAWLAVLLAVVVVVMAACLMAFLAAGRIGKLLGVTGSVVLSRLLGVLLAALAVQYVVDGIRVAFGF